MARYIKSVKSKAGIAPGTLLYDDYQEVPVKVDCYLRKNENTVFSKIDLDEVIPIVKGEGNFWINITGTPPLSWYEKLSKDVGIHRLTLEDILSSNQRPKIESYDSYNFISVKMIYKAKIKGQGALMEQLSLIETDRGVITFQHTELDTFSGIRSRLQNVNTRIYNLDPDYMVFCILDTIVDNYMIITEKVGARIDKLEDQLLTGDKMPQFVAKFSAHQRELNVLRKNVRPVKEVMIQILKQDNIWVKQDHLPFYNDVYDHLLLVVETIDAYRDLLSDLLNIHSTQVNNSMNEVMKTLTIFSAIFIPITFIAGVYGTNFDYLPELQYKYSYFIFWAVMLLVAAAMLWYFKRKRWF